MSFNDIKGQDSSLEILRGHMKNARLARGYLFLGPDGVGKALTAKTLAKALNCQENNLDSCDKCPSCLKIESNQHPDVHIVDSEDADIKIEDIRNLQSQISLRPYEARVKVFIIKSAHNLNSASGNAFLKTLEESPGNSVIILLSEKPNLLLKTIISRCQAIKFYPAPRLQLENVLFSEYALGKELAHFLAYFCEGRLGAALRLKAEDILKQKNLIIDEFALSKRSGIDVLLGQKRSQVRASLNILASWFRDMYILKIGSSQEELINLDRKPDLLKNIQRYSFAELDDILAFISQAIYYLEHNINVKLLQANLRVELWKA